MKDDAISRQAAIDAIAGFLSKTTYTSALVSLNTGKMILARVPSAQPEIIRCKDCKWFNDIGCAIRIVDDTDKPSEEDYCSFAERKSK